MGSKKESKLGEGVMEEYWEREKEGERVGSERGSKLPRMREGG